MPFSASLFHAMSTYAYCSYLRQEGYVFTLFVCLFVSRITQKLLNLIFTKFGGKVANGVRKNPLDLVIIWSTLELRLG